MAIKRKIHIQRGMTLIEAMIATMILVPAIIAILQTYMQVTYLSELTKERNIALSHIASVAEAIRCTPFNHVLNNFPNATTDGPAGNSYAALAGGYTLKEEHIVVTYNNTSSDPLEILVALTWQDMNRRQHRQYLTTMRTR